MIIRDAWKSQEGISSTEAKRRYISYLIETMRLYASGTHEARELLSELEYLWDQIRDVEPTEEDSDLPTPLGLHDHNTSISSAAAAVLRSTRGSISNINLSGNSLRNGLNRDLNRDRDRGRQLRDLPQDYGNDSGLLRFNSVVSAPDPRYSKGEEPTTTSALFSQSYDDLYGMDNLTPIERIGLRRWRREVTTALESLTKQVDSLKNSSDSGNNTALNSITGKLNDTQEMIFDKILKSSQRGIVRSPLTSNPDHLYGSSRKYDTSFEDSDRTLANLTDTTTRSGNFGGNYPYYYGGYNNSRESRSKSRPGNDNGNNRKRVVQAWWMSVSKILWSLTKHLLVDVLLILAAYAFIKRRLRKVEKSQLEKLNGKISPTLKALISANTQTP